MSPARLDRVEASVRTVVAFVEALNQRDLVRALALLSEDCLFEPAERDGPPSSGKAEVERLLRESEPFSRCARIEVEELFGMGLRCVLRWRSAAAGSGGAEAACRGLDLFELRNGLIYRRLTYIKA